MVQTTHSGSYYLLPALLAFVSILVVEAVFSDEISWLTVVLVPIATVIGLIAGDTIRHRRDQR